MSQETKEVPEIDLAYELRHFESTDLPFIASTYLDCLRSESGEHRLIPSDVFYPGQRMVLDRLLQANEMIIACLPDERAAILGWMIYGPGVLHFLYVKQRFRRMGIAKSLARAAGLFDKEVYFTHATILGRYLGGVFKKSTFNPYLREAFHGRASDPVKN